jgi:hypothetical protein
MEQEPLLNAASTKNIACIILLCTSARFTVSLIHWPIHNTTQE